MRNNIILGENHQVKKQKSLTATIISFPGRSTRKCIGYYFQRHKRWLTYPLISKLTDLQALKKVTSHLHLAIVHPIFAN